MPGARRRYDYTQSVIGDCGHTCQIWPQIHPLGSSYVLVCCDICTRKEYSIDDGELTPVYVRVKDEPAEPAPKKTTTQRAKRVKCSMCQKSGHSYTDCPLIVGQGSLFDG